MNWQRMHLITVRRWYDIHIHVNILLWPAIFRNDNDTNVKLTPSSKEIY
jgi:hypothetical protein